HEHGNTHLPHARRHDRRPLARRRHARHDAPARRASAAEGHEDDVNVLAFVVFLVFVSFTDEAAAQGHFEIGAQAAVARSSEFDRADTGAGGRLSWFPNGMLGAEAEMDVYPRSFPGRTPF